MSELITAFSLGNAAILTNVCLLPLYPGLIAFLAGTATNGTRTRTATGQLGVLVLAGILSMMLLIGLLLHVTQVFFGDVFGLLLPLIYVTVIVLGVLMLVGRNPFARLQTAQAPLLRNPYLTAYVYGLLLAPMTLPCTGPVIVTAFATGAGDAGALLDGLLFFLFFGLGFGWPLVVLPLLAAGAQRQFVGWVRRHHALMTRVSGVLLVSIGVFGILTELLPLWANIYLDGTAVTLFWLVVAALIAAVVYASHHARAASHS